MARRTYSDKTNEPYKQIFLGDNLFTDSCVSEADYIALSPRWKELREKRLQMDDQKCVRCGKAYQIQVHHRRYPAAWGLEKIEDLVTLCDSCHKAIHKK